MNLYVRLAWRNLWRHRRRTLIVMLAIGLVLSMMMMYDGLIAGFEQAIYGNAIQVLGGNIQVHAPGYSDQPGQNPLMPLENDQAIVDAAQAQPQVVAAARRINTGGMATSREGAFPVSIIGIEPDREKQVSLEAQNVTAGRYLAADDKETVFIGKGLAVAMNLNVGDRFTLVGRTAQREMRQHTMTVGGVYDLSMPDIEKRSIYMSLGEAQYLYGLDGKSSEVDITLKQLGEEPAVMSALRTRLPGYDLSSWQTNFPEMQSAINTKTGAMNIFSVIMMIIAGIGILNLLLMAIFERTREIGVLGALGMKPRNISALFLLEGALMGLVGLAFGVLLGLVFNFALSRVGFDYTQFSGMTSYTALIRGTVYPTLGMEKLLQRSLIVLFITLLASLYPALEASQKEPAQALHFV